jgi:hypothetical protein
LTTNNHGSFGPTIDSYISQICEYGRSQIGALCGQS